MPCPVTGLSRTEKRDVMSSWRAVVGTSPRELKAAGVNLVLWMFDNVPNMRSRFTKLQVKGSRTNLVADEMFLAHTQVVVKTLNSFVELLDDPRELKQKFQSVAKSHATMSPPVGIEFFEPFAARFYLFLETALGDNIDNDDIVAWEKFLYSFAAMVKIEEDAHKRASMANAHHGAPCCGIL